MYFQKERMDNLHKFGSKTTNGINLLYM